ncbi:hypothetical protein HY642_02675 [Candidatus Woesearchaeota archaeon]|nr:hypothetical protein [Candidatus Woesearchaeota archaeon]
MRKAQLTAFIILGFIALLAAFLLFAFLKPKAPIEVAAQLPVETAQAARALNTCVDKTGADALRLIGLQAGNPSILANETHAGVGIAAWYVNGRDASLSLQQIAGNYEELVEQFAPFCFENDEVKKYGIRQSGPANAKAALDRAVTLEVSLPATLTVTGVQYSLPTTQTHKYDVRFGYLYAMAKRIVQETKQDPAWIHYSTLLQYDVKTIITPVDSSIVYILRDNQSMLANEPYNFMFAAVFR